MRQTVIAKIDFVPAPVCFRLKEILEINGWSIKAFSQATGLRYGTLWHIANNKPWNPKLMMLQQIAGALGVAVVDLFCSDVARKDEQVQTLESRVDGSGS